MAGVGGAAKPHNQNQPPAQDTKQSLNLATIRSGKIMFGPFLHKKEWLFILVIFKKYS